MQNRVSSSRRPMGLVRGAGLAMVVAMGVMGVMGVMAPSAFAGDVNPPPVPVGGGTLTFTQDTFLNTTTIRFQGAINTSGLGTPVTGNSFLGTLLAAGTGDIWVGPGGNGSGLSYTVPSNTFPSLWPSSTGFTSGSFLGPDWVIFGTNGSIRDFVILPTTYVSGAPINAGMRLTGTFATLNIQPGTYSATIPGNGPITYVFATIPTPGAAALLAAGGLVAAGGRRRR